MKPFITEYDLINLQHTDLNYKNSYQADIFLNILDLESDITVKDFARFLYHRLIDEINNIWEIKFPDNSFCLLKITDRAVYAKAFPSFDYHDANRYFHDAP